MAGIVFCSMLCMGVGGITCKVGDRTQEGEVRQLDDSKAKMLTCKKSWLSLLFRPIFQCIKR